MGKGEAKRRQIDVLADIIMLSGVLIIREKTGFNGLAYLFAAYLLFYFLWIIFGRGASSVIARMLKGKGQRAQYRNLFAVKTRILFVQLLSGIAGSVLLFIPGRLVMEKAFGIEKGASIVMVLAPALLLRCLSEGYGGFLRGSGRELPTALSSVARSILIIIFALVFGGGLKSYGDKVGALLMQDQTAGMYAAIGAAIAADATEFLILAALFILDKVLPAKRLEGTRMTDPLGEIAMNLYMGRAEQVLTGLLIMLPLMTGLCVYRTSADSAGDPVYSLGIFVGTVLFGMVIMYKVQEFMVLPLAANVNTYNRKSDLRLEKSAFESGIHAMCVWGSYFVMIFLVLSKEWAEVLKAPDTGETASLFLLGSVMILIGGLSNYFGRLLALLDRRILLLGNLGIMNLVFLIVISAATRQMERPFQAVVLSALLTWGILCLAEGGCLIRITGIGIDWIHNAAIPAAAALLTGVIMYFVAKLMVPHIGSLLTIVLCALFSLTVIMVLLVLIRNIRESELKHFPGGWIAGFFIRLFSV